ncbi:hypothetical protein AB0J43_01970 [Nonomuraea fuscirosea]
MNRPPASIARQITTTLLPRYRPRVLTERAQWDLDLHQHTVRETEAARLAALLPGGRHFPDTYMSRSSTARWNSRRAHGGISVFGSDDGGLTYNVSFTSFQLSPAELDVVLALVDSLTPAPTSGQAAIAPAG